MEFCRIKRNQWSDEREMLMVFLLEQVSKRLGLQAPDSAQLESEWKLKGRERSWRGELDR